MADYRDIRVLVRDGRHRGVEYVITVWVRADGAKFSLEEVAIAGLPKMKITAGAIYDSADDAFAAGHNQARSVID
ncbi:hypothetical protein [Rhodanobacter thiooxydans]|uniref:hypothetical protein n=1 Tax=Rhodanobacter thiooxydans TaxID=416169 RepID=UPI000260DA1A|nr:hypothetical protein [Rhodanobacter thiooxydans]EIL99107.1 hypothetical protein UUA_08876 [Rhodanobacter thiooxydans LCS2]